MAYKDKVVTMLTNMEFAADCDHSYDYGPCWSCRDGLQESIQCLKDNFWLYTAAPELLKAIVGLLEVSGMGSNFECVIQAVRDARHALKRAGLRHEDTHE